jgi:chaperonin cofactor prefoldin
MTPDPNPERYLNGILQWWEILLFMGTMIVGFVLGNAKQRWTQDQLQNRVLALEKRIEDVERHTNTDSRSLLIVQNELEHIRSTLNDIKNKLEA